MIFGLERIGNKIKKESVTYWFGNVGKAYDISSRSKNGSIIPTNNPNHLRFTNGKEADTSFVRKISYEGNDYSVVKSKTDFPSLIILQNKSKKDGTLEYHPVEDIPILRAVFRENALRDLVIEDTYSSGSDTSDLNLDGINLENVINPKYMSDLMEPVRVRLLRY